MNFLELVSNRESVRAYTNDAVSLEQLSSIVEAGRLSPSACNSQPWHFYIIKDESAVDKMKKAVQFFRTNAFTKASQAFIVLLGENPSYPERVGESICGRNFRDIDMGIACANMTLQATSIGLGTCILGGFNESRVKDVIGVADRDKRHIKLVLSVGVPESTTPRPKTRKSTADVVTII